MRRIENSDNLQKIALSTLEVANKEKLELKSQVGDLIAEIASLKQQLEKAGEVYYKVFGVFT